MYKPRDRSDCSCKFRNFAILIDIFFLFVWKEGKIVNGFVLISFLYILKKKKIGNIRDNTLNLFFLKSKK